jgi:GH35 family endo-1,4-beta-xylanase
LSGRRCSKFSYEETAMPIARFAAALLMLSAAATAAEPEGESKEGPEPVAVLVGTEKVLAANLHAPEDVAAGEVVQVAGQPFDRAWRVTTAAEGGPFYKVQLIAPIAAAVAEGDALLVRFRLRRVKGGRDGKAIVTVFFQEGGAPYRKDLCRTLKVGDQWRTFALAFRAERGHAAGKGQFCFGFGHGPQTVELAEPECVNYGEDVELKELPRMGHLYAGHEADAAWRKAAAERIDRHRRADLAVEVVDAAGAPVPGAKVAVRQTRHAFWFGSTVAVPILYKDDETSRIYRRKLLELFNHCSTENALKWPPWESKGDYWNRKKTLGVLRWMQEKGLHVHGHVVLWPSWKRMPDDLAELKDEPEALARRLDERIVNVVGATRGLTDEWDVVNEPFSNHDLMDVLGPDAMAGWFKLAEKTNPDCRFYINDYGILTAGDRTDTPHQKHYAETIAALLKAGAPLEGIGLQSHFGDDLTGPETVLKLLDRFAEFGLPLQVTEFDVDTEDEDLQARYTRDFMTAVFSHPAVNGFCMWGFWEGRHWRPQCALFRKDWTIKPNGRAYRKLVLEEWRTDEQAVADEAGRVALRGFRGDYEVIVEHGGRRTRAEVRLPADGAKVRVKLPAKE